MSATVGGKKFTAKIYFPIGNFMLPLLILYKSKVSPYIISKVLGLHAVTFEQHRIVQTIQNFEVFDKKWLTIFDNVLTPFSETFLCLKQLFDT